MKHLFVLITLLTCSTAFAQTPLSVWQFRISDGKPLTIALNGRHFNKYGRTITVADVPQGMHRIKIYYFYPSQTDNGSAGRAALIYEGRIQAEGANTYYAELDPQTHKLKIRSSRTFAEDQGASPTVIDKSVYFSDEGKWRPEQEGSQKEKATLSYYKEGNRISRTDFNLLTSTVDDREGDREKLETIESFIAAKSLSAAQAAQLLDLLEFEDSKLRLAKFCYDKVFDREHYGIVENRLKFSSSKRALNEYIASLSTETATEENATEPSGAKTTQRLSGADFEQLKSSTATLSTDTEKLKVLQSLPENKTLSCLQVGQIIDLLTFEGSKLEWAKWAYPRVYDKQNFGALKEKFDFTASKAAVDKLIKQP